MRGEAVPRRIPSSTRQTKCISPRVRSEISIQTQKYGSHSSPCRDYTLDPWRRKAAHENFVNRCQTLNAASGGCYATAGSPATSFVGNIRWDRTPWTFTALKLGYPLRLMAGSMDTRISKLTIERRRITCWAVESSPYAFGTGKFVNNQRSYARLSGNCCKSDCLIPETYRSIPELVPAIGHRDPPTQSLRCDQIAYRQRCEKLVQAHEPILEF